MIEKDLSRIRFLHNVCMKGGCLYPDDIDFVIRKKQEIENIRDGIKEILDSQIMLEKNL